MSKIKIIMIIFSYTFLSCSKASERTSIKSITNTQNKSVIPKEVVKLMENYPQIIKYRNNYIFFNDNDSLLFNDNIKKDFNQLINNPSIKDMFSSSYQKGKNYSIKKNNDPGRYRNINFFKKIYGSNKKQVQDSLVKIIWCPKTVNQNVYVTKINKIATKLQRISSILDTKPHLTKYVNQIGGTFNWRNISNTDRLSMHSFGMTIDINIHFSDYWQWNCKCSDESINIQYFNSIPIELVEIFEKEGFIWGGKWYHYDTMHFEYRPELLN